MSARCIAELLGLFKIARHDGELHLCAAPDGGFQGGGFCDNGAVPQEQMERRVAKTAKALHIEN